MQQRGRRSSEALKVVAIDGGQTRLEPPDYLSEDQRAIFEEMVSGVSGKHFVPSDRYLLAAYAQAAILVRDKSKDAGRDLGSLMQFEKATRTLATLATKLRLAPQSRMDARVSERNTRGPKPWGTMPVKADDED